MKIKVRYADEGEWFTQQLPKSVPTGLIPAIIYARQQAHASGGRWQVWDGAWLRWDSLTPDAVNPDGR